MLNWLFKYYVTALRWGSAPPPGKCGVLVWGPLLGSEARPPYEGLGRELAFPWGKHIVEEEEDGRNSIHS